MKRAKKSVLIMAVLALGLISLLLPVDAHAMGDVDWQTEASYDLEKGGIQTFEIQNEDGNTVRVVIEEVNGTSRIANGTYKVKMDCPGIWSAGFQVDISGNKIISAYSPFHTTSTGSIKSAYLVKDSSTKASYHFTYCVGIASQPTGVRGYISGNNLKVSKL